MNKNLIFTDDNNFIIKLKPILPGKWFQFKTSADFPELDDNAKLVVIDGDTLPPDNSLPKIMQINRKKIPIVYLFSSLSGKDTMELLDKGVISVIFKDYPPEEIKSRFNHILFHFKYLRNMKNMIENENRTRQFFKVVNSLTSDNDINEIMNHILGSMISVFKLESTVFFMVKNFYLTYKMELGRCRMNYSNAKWEITNPDFKWLKDVINSKKPIYITKRSSREYKRYFHENTLLLPLVIKEQFLGMIAVGLKQDANELTRNEIILLQAFSEQTAVALENAKLYWDVIQAREKLIKTEKEALLNQAIISLNHEINNPLSIISMEAQLLQQRIGNGNSVNSIESRIAKIEKNIDRIKEILEKISALNVDNLVLTEYITGKKMLNLYEH